MPTRMTPAHIRSTLHLSLKEMEGDIGSFVKRPGKDFSRRRIGTFSDTILSIMTMEARNLFPDNCLFIADRGCIIE